MIKKMIHEMLNSLGYKVVRNIPPDLDSDFFLLYNKCKSYSGTTIERMYALYKTIQYIVEHNISGDIVECGVWKGGSSMMCAATLKSLKNSQKKIYMYDTYKGMPEPGTKDISYLGENAKEIWQKSRQSNYNEWNYASLDEVRRNLLSTDYPKENLVFIEGKVEETIPRVIPEKISLLRLDTDFYESTYHELMYLFPRLSLNGVIIIDDYGYWEGSKEATDRYFYENSINILLNRIDYSCRVGLKTNI